MDKSTEVFYELIARLLATNISLIHNQTNQSGSEDIIKKNEVLLTSLRSWLKLIKENEDLSLNIRNIVSMVDNIVQQKDNDLGLQESTINGQKEPSAIENNTNFPPTQKEEEKEKSGSMETLDPPLTRTSRTLEVLDRITEIGKVNEKVEVTELFQRMLTPNDQWSYLDTIGTVLRNYSHIMHLALPNYCFAILEDIHRYTSSDFEVLHTVITTPYYALLELIQKFLREAPSAQILRRFRSIRRMAQIDIDDDTSVDITEKNEVKQIVDEYFNTLKKFLDSEETPSIDNYFNKVKDQYSNFSLGPSQVESRIIIVIKNLIGGLIKKLDQDKSDLSNVEKVALLGSIDILMNLTDCWLSEGRIRSLLEAMKD